MVDAISGGIAPSVCPLAGFLTTMPRGSAASGSCPPSRLTGPAHRSLVSNHVGVGACFRIVRPRPPGLGAGALEVGGTASSCGFGDTCLATASRGRPCLGAAAGFAALV